MTDEKMTGHRQIPAPAWKVMGETPSRDGSRNQYHVKLGQKHVARQFSDEKGNAVPQAFVEVEYVHVLSTRKQIPVGPDGNPFWYNETAVTASDAEGNQYGAYLYFCHRALTLDEALFSIGEV